MNAKEYLEQIKKIDTKIKNKLIEKELKKKQYFDIALSVCSGGKTVEIYDTKTGEYKTVKMERVQASSNGDKMANAVIDGVDIEQKIQALINKLEEQRQIIIDDIEKLIEPEYDVLHMVYVQYLTFDEAAQKRKMSKSWVDGTHKKALANLEKISKCKKFV